MDYHGAYLENKLVGYCYTYSTNGCTCMDGLNVDMDYRHQYIATTLIKGIVEGSPKKTAIKFTYTQIWTTYRKKCMQKWDLKKWIGSMNIPARISIH